MAHGFARCGQRLDRGLYDVEPASWDCLYRRDELPSRLIGQHKARATKSFTREYGLNRLVWYETHELMTVAIQREKNIKKYPREWKVNLIEAENRFWDDLYPQLFL